MSFGRTSLYIGSRRRRWSSTRFGQSRADARNELGYHRTQAGRGGIKKEYRNLKHLLRASDHERQLIAYEIHDGLAQELAGAIMQFDAFDHLKETKPKQAADAYHAAMTMLRQGHFETRRLIAGVRPPILDEAGIAAAVGHLVNEHSRSRGRRSSTTAGSILTVWTRPWKTPSTGLPRKP